MNSSLPGLLAGKSAAAAATRRAGVAALGLRGAAARELLRLRREDRPALGLCVPVQAESHQCVSEIGAEHRSPLFVVLVVVRGVLVGVVALAPAVALEGARAPPCDAGPERDGAQEEPEVRPAERR